MDGPFWTHGDVTARLVGAAEKHKSVGFPPPARGPTMTRPMPKTCTLAIDVGGTFTDITFADAATGATWVAKTPSTPSAYEPPFLSMFRLGTCTAGASAAVE